jgi:hypothetical protein
MTTTTSQSLAAATANLLPLDPPPTEQEIDDVLNRMSLAFDASDSVRSETRRILHARYAIRMDIGQTLVDNSAHQPWLDGRRGTIDPFYWSRYREFLLRSGWPPLVLATLDRSTDELLDLLGNPSETNAWKRRGLVMGDVQSGKTASYAALISKAADADYRMIILLTGTLENVRRQTQERLDAAFIGFDSRDYLGGASVRHKRHIGVGLIDGRRDGVVFTSRDHDFRKNAASALNIALAAVNEPVLVVTKKNKGVLERLAVWLRARNADRDGKIDLPLLMIDDEADNASINTNQNPAQTTAINKAIRDLLSLFHRSSYVGFTATPFANIFIDPDSEDSMLGDDLFPRDFIHVLEPPTNYIGMNVLFPPLDPNLEDTPTSDSRSSQLLHTFEDGEAWLPLDHKKEFEPGPLPLSLREALRSFLFANAIRDLQAQQTSEFGNIHRSMLVNVSRFTDVQNRVADALHIELEDIRRSIRLYGALPSAQAENRSPEIAFLKDVFERYFPASNATWAQVLAILHESSGPVRVQPVNQSTGARSLDYGAVDRPPGVRVIAVGGNSLSRGLTLEGLSTSYFLRNSRGYDTLLQMGRWFGYRDGYRDLCGLWLTEEAEGWYRHITLSTAELRRDFLRMRRRRATPKEFGLRVRTHTDTLLITARNKMATGVDVEEVWDVSLVGRMIESSRLYQDAPRNQENVRRIDQWLQRLNPATVSPHGGALLWHRVLATIVADLLDDILVHPLNFDFQTETIAQYLRDESIRAGSDLSEWTVALLTSGEATLQDGSPAYVHLQALPQEKIVALKRKVRANGQLGSLLVSGKSARVGSRADLRHAFSKLEYQEATASQKDPPEDTLRSQMSRPLLVIYLLRGSETSVPPATTAEPYLNGQILPALGLHFPGEKSPDQRRVRYRLNRIAQKELIPSEEDGDDSPDDDDPDD